MSYLKLTIILSWNTSWATTSLKAFWCVPLWQRRHLLSVTKYFKHCNTSWSTQLYLNAAINTSHISNCSLKHMAMISFLKTDDHLKFYFYPLEASWPVELLRLACHLSVTSSTNCKIAVAACCINLHLARVNPTGSSAVIVASIRHFWIKSWIC